LAALWSSGKVTDGSFSMSFLSLAIWEESRSLSLTVLAFLRESFIKLEISRGLITTVWSLLSPGAAEFSCPAVLDLNGQSPFP